MRRVLFIGFFLLIALSAGAARAAETVTARAGDHQNFVRVVLEWSETLPPHQLKQIDDKTIEVSFEAPANLTTEASLREFPEIADVRRVSEPGAPLKLWVSLAEGGYRRELAVGRRLVLDIDQSAKLRAAAQASEKVADVVAATEKKIEKAVPAPGAIEPQSGTADKPSPAPEPPEHQAALSKVQTVVSVLPPSEKKLEQAPAPEPAKQPEIAPPPPVAKTPVVIIDTSRAPPELPAVTATDPPIITLGATEAFALSTFLFNGEVWIVVDKPKFSLSPRLSGKDTEKYKSFDRIELADATIFHTPVPSNVTQVRAEGGDLFWRVVLAPPPADVHAVEPVRTKKDGKPAIFWPFTLQTHLIRMVEPMTGEKFLIVTVSKSNEFTGPARRFVEFYTPPTGAGLAVRARSDDLQVLTADDGIYLLRPKGMSTTSAEAAEAARSNTLEPPPSPTETKQETEQNGQVIPAPAATKQSSDILFRFDRWAMGGVDALNSNEQALMSDIAEKKPEDRASGLLNLGKMFLSNGRGAEALGLFRVAEGLQPGLRDSLDFIGLRGAAHALIGQFDLAYEDLRNPDLDRYADINIWRAYTLGNLEDWQQAATKMPNDLSWLRQYPPNIAKPMVVTFAEIALRSGETKRPTQILAQLGPLPTAKSKGKSSEVAATKVSVFDLPYLAARDYLLGESSRQNGDKDTARELWNKLSKGMDDKYRARARLALTILDYEDGKIKIDKAIDNLERLRFAWRGDEVEASINARLGEIYLDKGEYLKGLSMLRDASTLSPDTDQGRKIAASMTQAFRSIFLGDEAKKIPPLDAISVFENFPELMPTDEDAVKIRNKVVDRLIDVDLLDRAGAALQDMIEHQLRGDSAVRASLRWAAIELLNRKPAVAIDILNRTNEKLAGIPDPDVLARRKREIELLRARAQFLSEDVDGAMSTLAALPDDQIVLRSKAEIAWQSGRWSDAAAALERLLTMQNIVPDKPPTDEQAELLRNLVVATNLSGDRGRLAQLREAYLQIMTQSKLANEFEVVTRERQAPTLADRETMNKMVSEVDIFGSFLDSYKAEDQKEETNPEPEKVPETTVPDLAGDTVEAD